MTDTKDKYINPMIKIDINVNININGVSAVRIDITPISNIFSYVGDFVTRLGNYLVVPSRRTKRYR